MNYYNNIINLLKKKYKHIKNIKNTRAFNISIIEKRIGIKINDNDKYYFFKYVKDICHLKDPDCGNCFLIEFCDALGDKFSYHKKLRCNKCGYCCTLLLNLTDKDITRIKEIHNKDDFIEEHLGRKYMKLIDKKCFFLRKNNKGYYCEIYNNRPQICRIYPSYDREIKECKEHMRLRILTKLP